MKKENLMQYVLLLLIAFIVIIGLVNSFKTSNNLKAALNGIKEAKELVKESSTILENQKLAIDGIKETNNNLNGVLNDMQNKNDKMKNAILFKLSSSDKILDSIKKEMGKFIPHPPLNNK